MTKKDKKINKDTVVTFGMLSEATEALLTGMQGLFDDQNEKLNAKFEKIDLTAKYNHDSLKKSIEEVKYDTPTLKQFNQLKDRVDIIYPTL